MSMAALRWARASRGITPTQKLVLLILADAANADGVCWNAAPSIAEETGLSDRAVRTALHDLIEAGAIAGTMRSGVRPLWTLAVSESGTTFHLKRNGVPVLKRNHVPSNRKHVPSKPETQSAKPEPGSAEPSRTQIEPSRTQIIERGETLSADGFEDWWEAYPRKQGKDEARRCYAKAVKRGVSEAVLALGLQRQRWPRDRKFIPLPATWLNQGRWQDDPLAAVPEPAPEPSRSKLAWMFPALEIEQ